MASRNSRCRPRSLLASRLKLHIANLQVDAHMASKNYKDFVEANETFKEGFNEGGKELPPARKATILTCMDAREQLPSVPLWPFIAHPIAPETLNPKTLLDPQSLGRVTECLGWH